MSDVTVKQFAEVVGIPVDRLLTQLGNAGLRVSGADAKITDSKKLELLTYLRKSHGKSAGAAAEAGPGQITLKRKTHSEIRIPGASGRGAARGAATPAKTVTVEVRKKRTYVKRSEVIAEEAKRQAEEEAEQEEDSRTAMARRMASATATEGMVR